MTRARWLLLLPAVLCCAWQRTEPRARVRELADAGKLDEAIAAWRRATSANDSSVAAVALAEALEFYAAETTVPPLFSGSEKREMIRKAISVLPAHVDEAKRKRVEWRIGQVNEPPAAVLLRAAIEADGAPCSLKEFELLQRVREVRRRVTHGEARAVLAADDLREAISLVDRFLIFRLKRLSAPGSHV